MAKKLVIFSFDGTLFSRRISALHDAPLDDRTVLPGVKAKIAELQAAGVKIGISTNQNVGKWGGRIYDACVIEERLEDVCVFLNLDRRLVRWALVGTWAAKPNPALLTDLRNKLGLDAIDVLFVGDRESDFQAAIRAHVDFEYAWGYFEGWDNGCAHRTINWEKWEDDIWRWQRWEHD